MRQSRCEWRQEIARLSSVIANLGVEVASPVPGYYQKERKIPQDPIGSQQEANIRYQSSNFQYDFACVVSRNPRIECPDYHSVDSFSDWICKCEHFFEVNQIAECHKIWTVSFHLYGEALEWHQSFMKDKENSNLDLEEYVRFMGSRFDKKLQQLGSVKEYLKDFEKVRFQANYSESQALELFLSGLKENLQRLVGRLHPTSVMEAFRFANLFDTAFESDCNPAPTQISNISYPPSFNNQIPTLTNLAYQKQLNNNPKTCQKGVTSSPENDETNVEKPSCVDAMELVLGSKEKEGEIDGLKLGKFSQFSHLIDSELTYDLVDEEMKVQEYMEVHDTENDDEFHQPADIRVEEMCHLEDYELSLEQMDVKEIKVDEDDFLSGGNAHAMEIKENGSSLGEKYVHGFEILWNCNMVLFIIFCANDRAVSTQWNFKKRKKKFAFVVVVLGQGQFGGRGAIIKQD